MKKRLEKCPKIFLLIIIILISALLLYLYDKNGASETALVTKVIDGDTFVIENGERVRLICINTPEKDEQGYQEAKDFLTNLVFNKTVILEKDVSNRDKYRRLLRYAYVSNTRIFINRELYQSGHAEMLRYYPDVSKCDEIYKQ